ncbi:Serine/threonine-protein kinase haspin [Daldinia childiae]|uniref:Serine/threonine-protein kinase haspin n=1 Tax=Daldinia childiae TaxID=326645 RepID=UPI001444D4FE|nr:Serine/threonine-protein kinase haspin [Daldinia childiae]KAF3064391.1 Serine/threonine-protein kinase haspin [Daldinia childiae]
MSKQTSLRKYGKQSKKPKADRLFVDLPKTPMRNQPQKVIIEQDDDSSDKKVLEELVGGISAMAIQDQNITPPGSLRRSPRRKEQQALLKPPPPLTPAQLRRLPVISPPELEIQDQLKDGEEKKELQVLSWADICPPGDKIVKIAEASYAEVYRVTNERGTSIIKVIRMESPIKAQTKPQQKSGLVDEEPHSESDLMGELKISEWLADIPGFVVYKERYIVQGKACKELLETHQAFHRKLKRQDPDRLQFYPSPSRYLPGTKFLVVELGDAGTALEDFELESADQLWDIFFHVTIALARAEAHIEFEHRDLHEGNLCIRKMTEPIPTADRERSSCFGFSGLDVTILDYGLSRAHANYEDEDSLPIAYDLERDLSIFTSEHAPQCQVYRRMRSFMLRGDRVCLPPKSHKTPYEEGIDGPICWAQHEPYTNVLWLAYIYQWMVKHFKGPKKEVNAFKRATKEFWTYLDPDAAENVPGFGSASDIVRFALESGWIEEDQLMGMRDEVEKSILSILTTNDLGREIDEETFAEAYLRRSPRRR